MLFYGMSDASSQLAFDDPSSAGMQEIMLCSSRRSRHEALMYFVLSLVMFALTTQLRFHPLCFPTGSLLCLACDLWGGAGIWIPGEGCLDPFMNFT